MVETEGFKSNPNALGGVVTTLDPVPMRRIELVVGACRTAKRVRDAFPDMDVFPVL
jgi:hypothetical protein